MKKTNKMVTVYDGNEHADRRVWLDKFGNEVVKFNRTHFRLDWCIKHFDRVDVWHD